MSDPVIHVDRSQFSAETNRLLDYEGPITRAVAYDLYCAGISLDPKDPRAATLEAFTREFQRPFRADPAHLAALARYHSGATEPLDQAEREAIDDLMFAGVINNEVGQPNALSRRGLLLLESCLAALDAIVDEPRLRFGRDEDCKRQPRPPIDPASN